MSLWIRANRYSALRFLFFRVIRPTMNFIFSNLEAVRYLFRRKTARRELAKIRSELIFVEDLNFWYTQRHFQWHSDPVGGWLDFVSKPWVSVAKNRGDCDDMMAIAEWVLKPHIDEGHRASAHSSGGGSHAVYIVKTGEEWKLVSNQKVRSGFTSPQQAVLSFYGESTAFIYIYGIGYFEGDAA